MLTPKNIWQEKQNKLTYIVNDLEELGVPRKAAYEILLRRGAFKWLAVRRDLIRLKDEWRRRNTEILEFIRLAKQNKDKCGTHYWKGYLLALMKCKKEIRALCHSERFRAPDYDRGANEYLRGLRQASPSEKENSG